MSVPQAKQTFLEVLFANLKESRDASMRLRKAAVQKEYMVARRLVEDAYSGFAPEDLPVDLQRVKRDLAVTRDQMADRACEEIDGAFKIAIGFMRATSDRFPKVYEQVMRQIVDAKAPVKPRAPKSSAPGVVRAFPDWVGKSLSVEKIVALVERLSQNDGVRVVDLFDLVGAETEPAKTLVKRFVEHLKTVGYVKGEGKTRGVRYTPTPTMKVLQTRMSVEVRAESDE
jgi:hypothetical protein